MPEFRILLSFTKLSARRAATQLANVCWRAEGESDSRLLCMAKFSFMFGESFFSPGLTSPFGVQDKQGIEQCSVQMTIQRLENGVPITTGFLLQKSSGDECYEPEELRVSRA